jgi:hypothetical protein
MHYVFALLFYRPTIWMGRKPCLIFSEEQTIK